MGNANGHVSDRRKSLSGGAPNSPSPIITNDINPHSAHNANVGSAVPQPLGAVSGIKFYLFILFNLEKHQFTFIIS